MIILLLQLSERRYNFFSLDIYPVETIEKFGRLTT